MIPSYKHSCNLYGYEWDDDIDECLFDVNEQNAEDEATVLLGSSQASIIDVEMTQETQNANGEMDQENQTTEAESE